MIVEFAGVPGAGKTTLAYATKEKFRRLDFDVRQPTSTLLQDSSASYRFLSKSVLASKGCVSDPRYLTQIVKLLANVKQRERRMYVKNMYNMLYVRGVYRLASKNNITLLDQGLLQGLWSINYYGRGDIEFQQFLFHFLTGFPQNVHFVLIEVPPDISKKRIVNRDTNDKHPPELEEANKQLDSFASYERIRNMAEEFAQSSSNISVLSYSNIIDNDIERIAQDLTDYLVSHSDNTITEHE